MGKMFHHREDASGPGFFHDIGDVGDVGGVGEHDGGVDEHCGGHDGHDVMVDRQYQYGKDVSPQRRCFWARFLS